MKFKLALAAVISCTMMASVATAATLSIVGGTDLVLVGGPGGHNPDYSALASIDPTLVPTVGVGDTVKAFGTNYEAFDGTNGLHLSGVDTIKIMFLGKDARARNTAMNLSGSVISNTGAAGAYIKSLDLPSWVDLMFTTYGITNPGLVRGTITNNVGQTGDPDLSISFYQESSKKVLAFFGDGRGDFDSDDMAVRISVVPLPAGGGLLLTAMVGGFFASRRKKKA